GGAVGEVLRMGCGTRGARFGDVPPSRPTDRDTGELWSARNASADGSAFDVILRGAPVGRVSWKLLGDHNVANALSALAAARHAGVTAAVAIDALTRFAGVKRRLEVLAEVGEVVVYDDFAHHPTAIRTTLQGLRNRVGDEEILAIVEPRTHTMSLGTLRDELITCCGAADSAFWFRGENIKWDLAEVVSNCVVPARLFDDLESLMGAVAELPRRRRHVVILSNGGFQGIHRKLPGMLRGG
ncbi:MAG: UDP-N-acetylmuramate:L-alanyl-gamma-D-glutamyl-meso-diaminopimelate ligase, partial [Gammaproteobacteria bacterium]|nr:UDP-N-acetylmuramate:L-alanyl-gamma-D-glutamyl-meso-diaminopimelate ligase [Gammaproteobacteria bacterium]